MFRINQLSKDLGMKPKEMQSLLAEAGIGEKSSSATLEADEFNLLLDTLTKKRQIKNLDLYLNGKTYIPSPARDEALSRREEKLRAEAEKEKMRGNLLRAVSHDIRTPLTAIVGGIDAILENGEKLSPETRTSLLENMRDESNWLIGVVENLLSVTRMSGASNIKKELEAGEEVLSAAAMKFQRHYPATRVEISAPDTLLMIPMDIILIEQVLINLMENAVQHGKTTTQISLRLTRSEDLAVFEVSDDGQGIAPALLPHLFDGYLTHDQEAISDKRRNMGIGLSVCKSIVQAHGGAMRACNRPAGGALLQFTLPLEETSHEDQRKSTSD